MAAFAFLVSMTDKVTGPAMGAAGSVTKLKATLEKIKGTTAATDAQIVKLGAELSTLKSAETALGSKLGATHEQIESLRSVGVMSKGSAKEVAALEAQARKLGAALDKVHTSSSTAESKLSGLQSKMGTLGKDSQKAGAELKEAQGASSGFGGALSALEGPAAIVAAIAASVGAVAIGLLAAGAKMAIDAAAFRTSMTSAYSSMLGSQKAGAAAYDQIDAIAAALPEPREKIHEQAKLLLSTGVQEKDIAAILKASSDLEAINVGGGEKMQKIIEKAMTGKDAKGGGFKINAKQLVGTNVEMQELIKQMALDTGKSVATVEKEIKKGTANVDAGLKALAEVVDKNSGGAAAKKMLETGVQLAKAKENIQKLFDISGSEKGKAALEDFQKGLHDLLSVFDQSTVEGKALHNILTPIFTGVFTAAKKVLPWIKYAFIELVITALRVWNSTKTLRDTFAKLFGDTGKGITMEGVIRGIGDAIVGVVQVVAFFATSGLWIIAMLSKVWGFWSDVFMWIYGLLADAVTWVATFVGQVIAWFGDIVGDIGDFLGDPIKVVTDFFNGLIGGITAGAARAVDAIKNMGASVIGGLKETLQSHSPSRVMMAIGGYTAEGFAEGVRGGQGKAVSAVKDLGGASTATLSDIVAKNSPRAATQPSASAQPAGAAAASAAIPSAQPSTTAGAAQAAAKSSSQTSSKVDVGGIVINIDGAGQNAQQIADLIPSELAAVFEKIAMQMGTGPEGAAT